MTNFQIVSDLHIEYNTNEVPDPLTLITPSADILILAGDTNERTVIYISNR